MQSKGPEVLEVERPWGRFRQFAANEACTVKILEIGAGQMISKQSHSNRDEFWVILDDGMTVEIGGQAVKANKGDEFFVPRGAVHRISSEKKARWLEVSFGHFDEGDQVRYEDRYGRG